MPLLPADAPAVRSSGRIVGTTPRLSAIGSLSGCEEANRCSASMSSASLERLLAQPSRANYNAVGLVVRASVVAAGGAPDRTITLGSFAVRSIKVCLASPSTLLLSWSFLVRTRQSAASTRIRACLSSISTSVSWRCVVRSVRMSRASAIRSLIGFGTTSSGYAGCAPFRYRAGGRPRLRKGAGQGDRPWRPAYSLFYPANNLTTGLVSPPSRQGD